MRVRRVAAERLNYFRSLKMFKNFWKEKLLFNLKKLGSNGENPGLWHGLKMFNFSVEFEQLSFEPEKIIMFSLGRF